MHALIGSHIIPLLHALIAIVPSNTITKTLTNPPRRHTAQLLLVASQCRRVTTLSRISAADLRGVTTTGMDVGSCPRGR